MRRRLVGSAPWAVGVAIIGLLLSLVVGHASSLSSGSRSLGANRATISSCDTDGFGILQNLSGANVVSVTVSQIASTCAGGTMSVTVNNGTTNSSGSATVPGGGGSLTVTLAVAVAAKDAEQIDVSVSGP